MADTQRSKSDILTLLADNTSGAISPQDLRDWLVSQNPGYGGLYISTSAETSIATVDTWTKVSGTTTATTVSNFTHTTNRLTYSGAPDVHVHIAMSFSCTAAANNKIFEFAIAKNGSVDDPSVLSRKIGTGADVGAVALHTDLMLSTNDYLEMYVKNTTDDTNVTFEQGYLFGLAMFA